MGNLTLRGNDSNGDLSTTIQNLLGSNRKFSMKVTEREYNIDVPGGAKQKLINAIEAGNSCRRLENYKAIETTEEGSPLKRQAKDDKTTKMKKYRKRAKKPQPTSTSNETDLPENNLSSNLTQPLNLLTLDNISCGSSCSTVTSDDEKNFNPWKFAKLREKKKIAHKQQKLVERTMGSVVLNAVDVNKEVRPKASTSSSDDDFCKISYSDPDEECKAKSSVAKTGSKQKEKPKASRGKENSC